MIRLEVEKHHVKFWFRLLTVHFLSKSFFIYILLRICSCQNCLLDIKLRKAKIIGMWNGNHFMKNMKRATEIYIINITMIAEGVPNISFLGFQVWICN